MKRFFCIVLTGISLCIGSARAERIERVAFGDFEHWTVRYIKESGLLGGKTKVLYVPGPTDTIRANVPYKYGTGGSPWSSSNAYARAVGVDKASITVRPERRGNGYCARLDCKQDSVVVMGMINIHVTVAGTIYTGKTREPATQKGAADPYSIIDMGIPFTKRPSALMLDYKARVEDSDDILYAKVTAHPKHLKGRDAAEVIVYLQKRWEDEDGNIHCLRVGTGYERIQHSIPSWINDHRIPIRWGDISHDPDFKEYEGLMGHRYQTTNSRGEMTLIQEEGWANEAPTHMILVCTASRYEAFVGHVGNTLWVDNIRLVYE